MSKMTYFEDFNEVSLTDKEGNVIFQFKVNAEVLQEYQINLLVSHIKDTQRIANQTKPKRITIKNLNKRIKEYKNNIDNANIQYSKVRKHLAECKEKLKKYDNTEAYDFIHYGEYTEMDNKQSLLFDELSNCEYNDCVVFVHNLSVIYNDIMNIIDTKEEKVYTM